MAPTLQSVLMAGLERVREVRDRLLARGDLFPIAIGPAEGTALRDCVRREGALRTIETGVGYAVSTLFICEGLLSNGSDGRHVAMDPYLLRGHAGEGLETLERAGVRELVEFFGEGSEVVLPRLLGEGRRFDLAFIDGNHRFEGVFLDLVYLGRLLEPGAVVIVDDMQLAAVRRAARFCVSNLGWTIEDEGREDEHEWAVLRTGSPDAFHRPFDSFVEF
jgi:predicted O-methyltransferase YrrM